GFGGSMNAAVVQPDGKIVVAGPFNQVNGLNRPRLARLNPDGSKDASLVPGNRGDGKKWEGFYRFHRLSPPGDGKILASMGNNSIVRFNPDGSRDLTFDASIVLAFDFGGEGFKQSGLATTFSDIIPLPDGQILVAGNFMSVDGSARPGLVRLNG